MARDHQEPGTDWFPLPVPAPRRTRYTELGIRPDATADEVRVATARQVRALKAANASQDDLADLNARALTNRDHRAAHDDEHPPCSLLRLQPTWSPLFDDPEAALGRLRADLEAFLLTPDDGTPPIPFPRATDLGRTDFSDEFRHHSLLDGKGTG
jgi:hypothetical protein